MADQKKAIREIAEAMIKRLEEASYNRQIEKHTKMTEIKEKFDRELQKTIEEEQQLKQFSEALIKLRNEIKSTEES